MIEYKIDKTQEIIFTTVGGIVTVVDVMAHIKNVLMDPEFSPNFDSIATLDDNATVPNIPLEKVELVQNVFEGYAQRRKGAKWAIVVSGATQRAMVASNLEIVQLSPIAIRLFKNETEALDWLKSRE
jgi:hypothetical protein